MPGKISSGIRMDARTYFTCIVPYRSPATAGTTTTKAAATEATESTTSTAAETAAT
jgi:hypothetical protein